MCYYGSGITKITESMGRVWLRGRIFHATKRGPGRRLRQRWTEDTVHFARIALIIADVKMENCCT